MVCAGIDPTIHNTILKLLAFPTSCDHYFYAKIFAGFWIILTFILYNNDKRDGLIKPDILSAMGVSAIATIFLAVIGTLLTIVQGDVFIDILVAGLIPIIIWIFKG